MHLWMWLTYYRFIFSFFLLIRFYKGESKYSKNIPIPKVAWARDPTHPFNNVYHRHKITVMFK